MKKTYLLFKDELLGFARSWVMIFLWIGLPVVALLMFFLLPNSMPMGPPESGITVPASYFISMIVASLGGTLAAIMVGVDIVNEKSKKVYDLFVIRPIPRGGIMVAKFFAVFICVTIACVLALILGLLIDMIRGVEVSSMMVENSLEAALAAMNMIAVSTAGGILVGVISPNVLIGVLLVLYGSQNLVIVPMLPTMLGLPDLIWVTTLASVVLAAGLMWLAALVFKRREF